MNIALKKLAAICLLSAILSLVSGGAVVQAQQEQLSQAELVEKTHEITDQMVNEFLTKLFEFYTFDKPVLEPMLAFISEHIDEKSVFSTEMHVNEHVKPELRQLSGKQLLMSIRQNYEKTYDSSARYKMESLVISDDGQSAHAKYHIWINLASESQEPGTGHRAEIRMKTLALCDDDFSLEDGILKIRKSKCVQDVIIAKPVFLE